MGTRTRAAIAGTLAAALALSFTAGAADGAKGKKKKKAGPSVVRVTKPVNAPIPQDAAAGQSTPVESTITVGKAFKGKVVGDLDVTGLTTTGSAAGAADDLNFKITAPNGRTVRVFGGQGSQNIGPLTLDDETQTSICDSDTPTCRDPDADLTRPFAGTANLLGTAGAGTGPLVSFDGVPMKGVWTLSVFDVSGAATTSTMGSWGLKISAAKPPKTAASVKKKKGSSVFKNTQNPALALPDATAGGIVTPVTSTITVPKSFAGRVVGDVDVTGIKTTGSAAGAANDIDAYLVAPTGQVVRLFGGFGDQSIGPWTLDDDTRISVCDNAAPTCPDPDADLTRPFAGTSNLLALTSGDTGPLSRLRGTPMPGAWKLMIEDTDNTLTSTLDSWGLKITAAKPVTATPAKKGGKKSAAEAAAKKKGKKKKPKSSVAVTKPVGQAIPNVPAAAGQSTPVVSTIEISDKAFKGQFVGDINVTGISTTGSAADAADDLIGKLTGPDGRTARLWSGFGDANLGPWTLDDESTVSACDTTNPANCPPPFTLLQPFSGTSNLMFLNTAGSGPLTLFDGSPIRGKWKLTVYDTSAATTSTFDSWGLKITAAKPVTG